MKEFEKVIGYEDVVLELKRVCDIMRNPEKYKKLGVTIPRGLLLHGKPGIGKTLMATCFLEASKWNVFICRKSKSNGGFVDEIKDIFEKAKKTEPAVILLDDMDKFANEDRNHRNAEEYVTIQTCIDEIREREIFVLATTNDLYNLPDSLIRAGRFDKIINMENPTGKDAEKIIQHYLNQKQYVSDISAEEIAALLRGNSCAQLETVINEAGIYAGYENKEKIEMTDILKACMRIIYGAREVFSEEHEVYFERVACHEAGHVVVSEILEPGSVNLAAIYQTASGSDGITSYSKHPGIAYSKKVQEHRVITTLAGKAAIELKYEDADVGCNNDMKKAFNLVETFVDDICAYGFDKFERDSSSDLLYQRKELFVYSELEHYYQKAKQILIENRVFLEAVIKSLYEKKVLLRKDIEEIKQSL